MRKSYGIAIFSFIYAIALLLYACQRPLTPIPDKVNGQVQSYDLDYRPLPHWWILLVLVAGNVTVAIAVLLPKDIVSQLQKIVEQEDAIANPQSFAVETFLSQPTTNQPVACRIEEHPEVWELLQDYLPAIMPSNLKVVFYLATLKSGYCQGDSKLITPEEIISSRNDLTQKEVVECFQQLELSKYGTCYTDGEKIKFLAADLEV
ncbi:hypothetical protein FD723_40625 (plasmid) [Nostoc sp. C052]|uniref:hypothetical protein n=1 Tax=Nostoc sp. C052 TaxID=2576902 RepID=UPI0015C3B64A|nr:hypothetical protein [Nostoc sp. C052]QLE46520.1 hypothetical protein FD723_40625 [Nostoc sp. C052]